MRHSSANVNGRGLRSPLCAEVMRKAWRRAFAPRLPLHHHQLSVDVDAANPFDACLAVDALAWLVELNPQYPCSAIEFRRRL